MPFRSTRRTFFVALTLAGAFVAFVFFTQSLRSADPDHGDTWTDTLIVLAARSLRHHGFARLHYAVTLDDGPEFGLPPLYYAHWPSFPAVALAGLGELGLSIKAARIFPLLASTSAILALFVLVRTVMGSPRAAVVAAVALAAAAPFQLLSDAFGYQSYDFAAKAWTLVVLTLASLSTGRTRIRWLAASAAVGFGTLFFCGFEMVPAIVVYAALFPFVAGAETSNSRLRRAATNLAAVAIGLVLASTLRLVHNAAMLGGWGEAIADFAPAYAIHSTSSLPAKAAHGVAWEIVVRVWRYYPWHVGIVALLLPLLAAMPSFRAKHGRALAWWAVLLLGEVAWFFAFPRHVFVHSHTVDHLAFTLSSGVALTVIGVLDLVGDRSRVRVGVLAGVAAALALSMLGVGVRAYGNCQARVESTEFERLARSLAADIPKNGVLSVWTKRHDPRLDYFLERRTLYRRGIDESFVRGDRALYVLSLPRSQEPRWDEFVARYRLVRRLPLGHDLFDTRGGPGDLNAIALNGK